MQQKNASKRLAIYFFYDKDGIADGYVDYFLNGLKEVAQKIIVVCNGILTLESRTMFEKYSQDIIVRENVGLDVWAYKTALEYVGWDTLRTYYEVLLVNFTIMGPVYPFSEMFDKMDRRTELDFWGINTWQPDCYEDGIVINWCGNPYGHVPEHVQSHFMVYRNKFLQSKDIREYWDNVPLVKNYVESVGLHESYFTRYFAEKGFLWASYVSNKSERAYSPYYLFNNPVCAISEDHCPIFKRKSFFYDYGLNLELCMGEPTPELFKYLQKETDYPVDLIWENILRTCNQSDFVQNLNLNYILPSENVPTEPKPRSKVALIGHLYYMDLLERSLHYISSMPESADIYITVTKPEHKKLVEQFFSVLPNRVEVRLIQNQGRDVSALLVGTADIVDQYDYICFYHDKKSTQFKPYQIGRSFAYLVDESTLHSHAYVKNIIATFEQNSRLGLMTPLPPSHANYYMALGFEWGDNFLPTQKLAQELRITVPMSADKPPIAPLGTVFWFRAKALLPLLAHGWSYSDFPEEPIGTTDGTIMHAIERIYPFAVQNSGFYPAYVMPEFMAGLGITQMRCYVRNLNIAFINHGITGSNQMLCEYLDDNFGKPYSTERLSIRALNRRRNMRMKLKKIAPKWLYVTILKFKRFILGPRSKKVNYDE